MNNEYPLIFRGGPLRFLLPLLLLILLVPTDAGLAQTNPLPGSVTIAGTIQSALGCPGDWQPECEDTGLNFDPDNDLWLRSWVLPAGAYEYKATLNGSWDLNYGLGAEQDGPNIPLELSEETRVTFYFDYHSGWITDDVNSIIATVPGSYQDEVGCPGEWAPDCMRSWLQDPDSDGVYVYETTYIGVGSYEAKVAINRSWDQNYGLDGAPGGANIPFEVPEAALVRFIWDSATQIMTVETEDAPEGALTEPPVVNAPRLFVNPDYVTIPGTIQSQLGCPGDWQPDCEATFLTLDEDDDVWQGIFNLAAGDYEYKVAINQSWDENYGGMADRNGPNVSLSLPEASPVKFYYDHKTHWVADTINDQIITVVGDFQSEIGCSVDDDASCLRSWLQDPDGDGIFIVETAPVPAGNYQARIALGEAVEPLYGADGSVGGAPLVFTVAEDDTPLYFEYNLAEGTVIVNTEGAPKGNLAEFRAYWVTADTIAWQPDADDAVSYKLFYDLDGALRVDRETLGGEEISLSIDESGLPGDVLAKFPHLLGQQALTMSADDLSKVRVALKGQIAVAAFNAAGFLVDATSLQIPGVLDDLYSYDGSLGVVWEGDVPSIHLWAPTARSVKLQRFVASSAATPMDIANMRIDPDTGVWSITGDASWDGQYYLFDVEVYVPREGAVVHNIVTDPYSISLSMNSERSQIINFTNPELMPEGWGDLTKPELAAPEDIVLYELHIRDFSIFDQTVPEEFRGTYMAFTVADSAGMTHLQALAGAGLTHIHLLPAFDIASVNEDKSTWPESDYEALAALPPDSEEQQAIVSAFKGEDGFNWGYDPYHYNAPEGSYATDPDGAARVREFRAMVQALNVSGLRVVMDVVYNHTNASGQSERSVLDRVVPGYYHRLGPTGSVERSTCCENTATEHNMMRKLMVDSVMMWATVYKVDGFRFDLMGHHMVDDMATVRAALDGLTEAEAGVQGEAVYVYGEGWNFGEVADGVRGQNATQLNMAGTGIGTFNDRIRDAIRGGSPFGGHQEQGFINGLYYDPNEVESRPDGIQRATLLLFMDQIRVALAGNLADYSFTAYTGETVTGSQIQYGDAPAGYTADPQEHIAYISAHDNETLFDAIQYKAPATATMVERVRMQNMGLSLVMFSQGIPFFHAGSDMLRSKSFDRDSYDSGDWYNGLDWSYQRSGFGVGLPVADKNQDNYPIMQPLLADPALQPSQADILASANMFREWLQIRRSSPLFRLQTASDVQARLAYHNTGSEQLGGLIVMSLLDAGLPVNLDANADMVMVLFNATTAPVTFAPEMLQALELNGEFALHPVLVDSSDLVLQGASYDAGDRSFTVPGRTTAVFVLPEGSIAVAASVDEPAPEVMPEPTAAPEVALTDEPSKETAPSPTLSPEASATAPDEATPAGESGSGLIWGIVVGVLAALAAAYLLLRRRLKQA